MSVVESLLLESVSRSTRLSFKEPLTLEDQCFIEWLSERYQGRDGTPVMCFICDGTRTLVVPTDLQRKRVDEPKPVEATGLHGVPSNG